MSFSDAVEAYGAAAQARLSGPGEREALLVVPISNFIETVGALSGSIVVPHDEVSELGGAVRPDFAIRVDGLVAGHVELKAPGTSLDPLSYGVSTHNYRQWQRLRELPNLLHTNGIEFRLWRFGELVGEPAHVHASDLSRLRGPLQAPDKLHALLTNFLTWDPPAIASVKRLVEVLAPMTRMLRETVHEALRNERRLQAASPGAELLQPFLGIRRDWRRLLFPQAKDEEFSDSFAQTVVFALLLAVADGIDLTSRTVMEVAQSLETHHGLMGRSLRLLTEHVTGTPTWTAVEMIVRVLSHSDWATITGSNAQVYLHLYEDFLAAYDADWRRASGSYYTPVEIVDAMVGLADEAVKTHLRLAEGLRHPDVAVVDPAMGTGTYPLSVLRHVGREAAEQYGPGAASEAVRSAAARTFGIELQSGPFSVAELRLSTTMRDEFGVAVPDQHLNLYVADTLEDPYSASEQQLSYTAQLIAQQRIAANRMKRERNVQVCIGNPPWKDHAGGKGGWIESGVDPATGRSPMDAFKVPGNGKHERHLSNLYAYFWRWATWKVFESTNDPDVNRGDQGVVCFITATGYLASPGFRGMREYLRRTCRWGWVINLSPEGKRAPSGTAVFGIETPVAIGLFVRDANSSEDAPADIRYLDLHGTRQNKFDALSALRLDSEAWQRVRTGWHAPFTPESSGGWDDMPALDDLLPWRANGIMAGRGWVYAPSREVLSERWRTLVLASTQDRKAALFPDRRDASSVRGKRPLVGADTEQQTSTPVANLMMATDPAVVQCGFRAFDRQYVIADSRVHSQPSPTLWEARIDGQVFAIELHSEHPRQGPGVVFTNLIPDVHHFRGSGGGRALPMLNPDGSANVAPGVAEALSRRFGVEVAPRDVFAYIAGLVAHPDYIELFDDELTSPGLRVPMTADAHLFAQARDIGWQVIWLHTFGKSGAHRDEATSVTSSGLGPLPRYETSIGPSIPTAWSYDEETQKLHIGPGVWGDVSPAVARYRVGGSEVVESWIGYRLAKPKKRHTSELDGINATEWDSRWSVELSEILAVLTQLIALEPEQSRLLMAVMAGETIARDVLAADGVEWPVGDNRSPRRSMSGGLFDG